MSFKATCWAVEQSLPALQKLVLIILSDRHNGDTQRCTPSMKLVARDCGMSESSVKNCVRELVEKGYLTAVPRFAEGVQLSNSYILNFAKSTPVGQEATGGGSGGDGGVGQEVPTINQEVKPRRKTKTLETQLETPIQSSKAKTPPSPPLPDWLDREAWDGFVQMRKTIKKPLTMLAEKLAIGRLDKFRESGRDPTAILNQSILCCYQGLFEVKDNEARNGARESYTPPAIVREQHAIAALERSFQREHAREQERKDLHGGDALGAGDDGDPE